jgi:hypothetical protein
MAGGDADQPLDRQLGGDVVGPVGGPLHAPPVAVMFPPPIII